MERPVTVADAWPTSGDGESPVYRMVLFFRNSKYQIYHIEHKVLNIDKIKINFIVCLYIAKRI